MISLKRALDRVYDLCGVLAAACVAAISLLVFSEIILRFFGGTIPGVIELAMFSLLAASFLALAQTLRRNEHIRITILIGRVPMRARRWLEMWSLAVSACIFATMAYYTVIMAFESYEFNEMSDGVVGIPLWIPQVIMFVGIVLVTIAFIEELITTARGGLPVYVTDASENPELNGVFEEEAEGE